MASSPAEFASCLLPSSDNNSWLPSSEPQNNVDLSWLPNHQHLQTDSDDSWLPNHNDTSKSTHSNRPRKTEQDSDDSWLPAAPIVNHSHDSRLPKHNNNSSSTISSKSGHSIRSRKTETGADHSRLPSTPIVNNGDKKKQTNNSNNNSNSNSNRRISSNHSHWERAREAAALSGHQQIEDGKVSNRKSASSTSECSVETDSLGGVSTLLRRWKDAETKNSNRKSKPESCINNSNQKTDESFVDSVLSSSRGSCDLKLVDVEKERIRTGENKCFSPVVGKPRLRGRQAFVDFLNMVEQDKRRELESLTQRKSVSKFPNRGRIQALLRVRFIRIRAENLKEAKSHKHSVSKTMKSIWDKFSTGVKQDTPASRKVKNNGEGMKKTNTSPDCSIDCSPIREVITTTTATAAVSSQEPVSTTASHQSAQEDTHSEILLPNTVEYHQKSQCLSGTMYPSGLENCHQWISECSQTQSDWDDDDDDDDDGYYSYNWISDIARPRSDWECMRQKRYQEMLHLQSYNHDIQQLLERKSVSGFLSSDQRNLLDQLMVSRAQGVSRKEEKHEEDEFIDQTAGPSPPTRLPAPEQRSWNHHRHRRHQHPYLQNNNTPQTSFINHPSIEMELMYELRVHLQQIHQEVMELRKAVTSCIKMQVKNQHQSVQNKRNEQPSPTRNCCVCYAMQADSILYRCGHMCACYDCGLELQCTSGKCPICEDPILDVVRAYAYGD